MYSEEIRRLLEYRNYVLEACSEELLRVVNVQENPQLDHITYLKDSNEYEMWSKSGEHFKFKVKMKEMSN